MPGSPGRSSRPPTFPPRRSGSTPPSARALSGRDGRSDAPSAGRARWPARDAGRESAARPRARRSACDLVWRTMTPSGTRLTLVTELFDLAAREQNNQRRTAADYFVAARRVLALDEDMV